MWCTLSGASSVPHVYVFGSKSFFSLKTFVVFSPEFISKVTYMKKDRKEFSAKK
jgi:hypothetical protein